MVTAVSEVGLELPDAPPDRKAIRSVVRPWIRSQGLELDDDLGHRFLYLRLL